MEFDQEGQEEPRKTRGAGNHQGSLDSENFSDDEKDSGSDPLEGVELGVDPRDMH